MNIYTDEFIPTYLYIKQHSITKKLYFGKTTKINPNKYAGSGTYWKRHIKKYGKQFVVTLWYCLFLDKDELIEFATNFSIQENIVESELWANLVLENGLDGASSGFSFSIESRRKMSESGKGRIFSEETKQKISVAMTGKTHSEETLLKMSISHIGKSNPPKLITCPYCGKVGGDNIMKRYHFDNCKFKIESPLLDQII